MTSKSIVIGLALLLCLNLYGQSQNTMPISEQHKKTEIQALDERILQLSTENETLQKQLENTEKEVERYREDARSAVLQMNTNMALWLGVLTIIMAILGVAIPLILNRRNEKSMDIMLQNVKNQANSADIRAKDAAIQAEQAKRAVADLEVLKIHVDDIKKKINEDVLAAVNAAKEAQASQLFAQALSEKDTLTAIELYSKVLTLKPDYAAAYNNRAHLKSNMGDLTGALSDYDEAISLVPDYYCVYTNRSHCYRKLAETEEDPAIRAAWISKAKADEKDARLLANGGKRGAQ